LQAIQDNPEVTKELSRVHRCQFCGKTFARKPWFLRHVCAQKRKFEETNDVMVHQGFRLYVYWMQKQKMVKRGREPNFDKFLKSPVKGSFVKLAMFARECGITSPYNYIDWIITNRIKEYNWCKNDPVHIDTYKKYANEYENPEDQALSTLREIEKWILEKPNERSPELFFSRLSPGSILTMVRQGRIKPWPLLAYQHIVNRWLADDVYNADVFYRIDDLINCGYWAIKTETEPDSVKLVNQVMDQIWGFQT